MKKASIYILAIALIAMLFAACASNVATSPTPGTRTVPRTRTVPDVRKVRNPAQVVTPRIVPPVTDGDGVVTDREGRVYSEGIMRDGIVKDGIVRDGMRHDGIYRDGIRTRTLTEAEKKGVR